MRLAPLTLVFALAAPLSLLVDEGTPDRDQGGRALAVALELEHAELVAAPAPDAARRAAVARATGAQLEAAAEGAYFAGLVQTPAGELDVRVARLPVAGVEGAAAVVFALGGDGTLVGAAVVDEHDLAVPAWSAFTENLGFAPVPKLAEAQPRSALQQLREQAVVGKTEDERLAAALLELLRHMHAQASVFNTPRGTHPLSIEEQATMMAESYAAVAALAVPLAPLLGANTERFAELGRDSAEVARAAAERGGALGREDRGKLFGNCRSCHSLPLEGGEAKQVFARARKQLGIGDGFYEVGHDLRVSHADREAAQRVADALRKAALLLDPAE